MGEAGDAYESHADEVADRVVAGQSAEALLENGPGTSENASSTGGVSGASAVQRRTGPQISDQDTAGSAGATATVRGGSDCVVQRGDSLTKIAREVYGATRYWRNIMRANPTKVSRGGDLIITGETLHLPSITIGGNETPTSEAPTVEGPTSDPPPIDSPAAGPPPAREPTQAPPNTSEPTPEDTVECAPAVTPRGECTDFGNFMIYPDDYCGSLPPEGVTPEANEEHVRESELATILAEREATAIAERETALTEIDELLSYGAFDWAITDAEATRALNLLGGLHITQLRNAVGRIDAVRLVDNLPAAARRTPSFAKVIVALGPAHLQPVVQELLSYGLFDWAITDNDVRTIGEILDCLDDAGKETFLRALPPAFLSRYTSNLNHGTTSNELFRTLFDIIPDTSLVQLKQVMGARFNIDLDGSWFNRWRNDIEADWDAAGLRRLYEIFETLPPGHIENNPDLDVFLREGDSSDGSGWYQGGASDTVGMKYTDPTLIGPGFGSVDVPDGSGGTTNVGLHNNVNSFTAVVRHEIGHSVDANIGASSSGGYVRTAANAGAWETYGSAGGFVRAIIAAGGGMSGHGYPDEDVYEEAMHDAVDDEVDFVAALNDVDASVAAPTSSVSGPVAAVFEKALWHPKQSPWYRKPNRTPVGGRQWHQTYDGRDFTSFLASARTNNGVSGYQFRAPGEWFAEAYAVYYSDQDGTDAPGTRLRTRDSATASWFDTNVDGGHSLTAQTGGAGGGAGGGGGGGGAVEGASDGAGVPNGS